MTFSRDGGVLAAAFGNAEIVLWRTDTWEQVAILTSNISQKSDKLVFSWNGKYLASAERRLVFWNLEDYSIISLDFGERVMNQAVLSLEENTFAICLESKDLVLVNIYNGEIRRVPGCRPTGRLAFLPDGRLLRANGQLVDVVDLSDGTVTNTMRGHAAMVNSLYVYPNDSKILSSTYKLDNYTEVFLWTTEPLLARVTQFKIPDFTPLESRGVIAMAISPDGSQLVASRQSGMIDAFNLPDEYQLWIARVGTVMSMAYSPDTSLLAIGDRQGQVTMVDTTHGKQLYPVLSDTPGSTENVLAYMDWDFETRDQRYPIQEVLFLPDGSGFYTFGDDGVVRLWGVP